jgi:predicted NUDIX family NTP pyrophosphohydrolase
MSLGYLRYFEEYRQGRRVVHNLSGVALVVSNRLLMVLPSKYSGKKNRWSIPKGRIEGDSFSSALKEMEEETGVRTASLPVGNFYYQYSKGGVEKKLEVIVIKDDLRDIEHMLDGWNVKKEYYDNNEIDSVGFFTFDDARDKMEVSQKGLIDMVQKLIKKA